ncbi:MAG: hypothetical protein ABGW78_04490 [Pirellulales bacterium]
MRAFSCLSVVVLALISVFSRSSKAAPAVGKTGFDPRIIAFGESREQIKNTPIEKRAYRPLHVYGNTVRRRHYRNAPSSRPRTTRRR